MEIIQLPNGTYLKYNGGWSAHRATPRQGGELFCGFRPQIGDTESLEKALRYVGATNRETKIALKRFE